MAGLNVSDAVIVVTPEELDRQAGVIDDIAQKINGRFEAMSAAVERSRSYWQGDAADAHRTAFGDYKDEILEIVNGFKSDAENLRTISANYKVTESDIMTESSGLPADIIF